jgi:hypothetical protein
MYSMTLESRLRLIADHQDRAARQAVVRMVKSIAANNTLLTDTGWLQDAMREMIECDGVAVIINGAPLPRRLILNPLPNGLVCCHREKCSSATI